MQIQLPLAEHIRLNQPLPWDVFNVQGLLLLRKGSVPTDARQIEALVDHGAYVDEEAFSSINGIGRAAQARKPLTPFEKWDDVHLRLGSLLRRHDSESQFVDRLCSIAAELIDLVDMGSDIAIFAMSMLENAEYPVAHALQVAVYGEIYGRFFKWDRQDRLALIKAALTMNITIIDLQSKLCRQSEPPTSEQLVLIKSHPTAARDCLESHGVTDMQWLNLIAQHHESADGSGYPYGLKAVAPTAEVLNMADRYLAITSRRRERSAKPPNVAARELYVNSSGETQAIVARLIKAFGMYPPGSIVKLASGDIAVVVKRGEQANKPMVATLIGAQGTMLKDALPRDSANPEYAIVSHLSSDQFPIKIEPEKLFAR